jgi:glycosyltransferase involved in cell wall biosynthesis
MMRVLFVEASAGGVVGGSLTGLYHLIRGLHGGEWSASMALYEPKAIEPELAALGVPVFHLHRRRLPKQHGLLSYDGYHRAKGFRPIRSGLHALRQGARLLVEELPAAARLAAIIRRERPDVVHLGNGLRANFDGMLGCLATRTPVVCHVKGFEKYGWRERWASRRTKVLVCMTRAVQDHCRACGLEAPDVRVVYDAVDETWLRPQRSPSDIRSELGIPEVMPCLGLVGNIQEWKGQAILVEAMERLSAAGVDVCALLIGGTHRAGEEYAVRVRRRVTELGLDDRVVFTGFRKDVVDVINALDILVHTSVRPEPFGRVILEGMLLEKVVVATAAGGVPELIEDGKTGYLVPPGDAAALAACLRRVLSDRDGLVTVGQRAGMWARERFSLSRQVGEMKAVYESAVRGD